MPGVEVMTCKNQTHHLGPLSNLSGGVESQHNRQDLITYKYLDLTPEKTFVSPVARKTWHTPKMGGEACNPESREEWVWSCLTPDNPELKNYRTPNSVLVTLRVWGKVLIHDNGVVQSEYAQIIGYSSDDYYCALLYMREARFEEVRPLIATDTDRIADLLENCPELFTPDDLLELWANTGHPKIAYLTAKLLQRPDERTRQLACQEPRLAYEYAKTVDKQPRDDTRQAACRDPHAAYRYARDVDAMPRPDTRSAACQSPTSACYYAIYVDKQSTPETLNGLLQGNTNSDIVLLYARHFGPDDRTREFCCQRSHIAYQYAVSVDKRPRDDTRRAACQNPHDAVRYARDVDRSPRDDTRAAACLSPQSAFEYAAYVDRKPLDETRVAASKDPQHAYFYAKYVDKHPHPCTWDGVRNSPEWSEQYRLEIGTPAPLA